MLPAERGDDHGIRPAGHRRRRRCRLWSATAIGVNLTGADWLARGLRRRSTRLHRHGTRWTASFGQLDLPCDRGSTPRRCTASAPCSTRRPSSAGSSSPTPHGGLTVVHGGGNRALLEHRRDHRRDRGRRVPRHAARRARPGATTASQIGQRIQIQGEPTTREIVGFDDWTCPVVPGRTSFAACGSGSVMRLSRRRCDARSSRPACRCTSSDPRVESFVGDARITHDLHCPSRRRLVRGRGLRSRAADLHLRPRRAVHHRDGHGRHADPGQRRTDADDGRRPGRLSATTPCLDGGARMGGDHVVVCNLGQHRHPVRHRAHRRARSRRWSSTATRRQDGVWYSGEPTNVKGIEFGPKPFDPFVRAARRRERGRRVGLPAREPVRPRRQRRHRRPRAVRRRAVQPHRL